LGGGGMKIRGICLVVKGTDLCMFNHVCSFRASTSSTEIDINTVDRDKRHFMISNVYKSMRFGK